ncbi:hypothetical protein J2S36_001181 [Arcanobacterium hippocoleae]|uniref:Uncharacterized protein n=1 Tax=Arcanobacterium hippocoleae TaxID=149017 RepID=A0ABU1T2N8_9ACTO|nr:hypothetical protein [Arcanobacterium hippocoleae]
MKTGSARSRASYQDARQSKAAKLQTAIPALPTPQKVPDK